MIISPRGQQVKGTVNGMHHVLTALHFNMMFPEATITKQVEESSQYHNSFHTP